MSDYGHPITFGPTEWSVDLGFDTFIFWPTTAPLAELEVFATEVVPGVRQRVSERREVSGLPRTPGRVP
jgi:hypothetical protein